MRTFLLSIMVLALMASGYAEDCALAAESTLTVLSNNVGIFPGLARHFFPGNVKEKKQAIIADEEERARALAKALLAFDGKPDILLLQEIWSTKACTVLKAELRDTYPHCAHPPKAGVGPLAFLPGGLMMFSRYALSDFQFRKFSKGVGWDARAGKGIMGARLTKDGRDIAVFTTHMQAGNKRDPSVRPVQLRECREFVDAFLANMETGNPIALLAGDFNTRSTDAEAYGQIFEILTGAKDTHRPGCGEFEKTGRFSEDPNRRIDYLLVFGETEALSIIVDPAGQTISDHLAVFGTIALD